MVSMFSLLFIILATNAFPITSRNDVCPVVLTPDPPAALPPTRQAAFSADTTQFTVRQPRIVNGDYISPNLLPYMVFIDVGCTGALISPSWFISAAHCEIAVGSQVVIGDPTPVSTTSDRVRQVVQAFSHPLYGDLTTFEGIEYDIGVFRLNGPAPSTSKFMKLNANLQAPVDASFARVMGFGVTAQGAQPDFIARQVDLPIFNLDSCMRIYNSPDFQFAADKQFCAGYERGGCDSCQGDSGGPLIQYTANNEAVHVGVVSFGAGCAQPNRPGVYVRTSAHLDFFEQSGAQFERSNLPLGELNRPDEDDQAIPDTPNENNEQGILTGDDDSSDKLSTAAIIGIAVGAGVLVLLFLVLCVCCCFGLCCFKKSQTSGE